MFSSVSIGPLCQYLASIIAFKQQFQKRLCYKRGMDQAWQKVPRPEGMQVVDSFCFRQLISLMCPVKSLNEHSLQIPEKSHQHNVVCDSKPEVYVV